MYLTSSQEYANFRAWVPRNVVSVGVQNAQSWLYYDWGPRSYPQPLVCFHPLVGSSESFFHQIIALAPRGYRVLSIHIPVYWSVTDFCDALHMFLDMLNLQRIHVYAAGLGAFLASQYALRKPDRVLSIILTHPLFSLPQHQQQQPYFSANNSLIPYSPGVLRWLPQFLVRSTIRPLLPSGLTTPTQAHAAEFVISNTMSESREVLASRLALLVAASKPSTSSNSSTPRRRQFSSSISSSIQSQTPPLVPDPKVVTLIDTLDRPATSLALSNHIASYLSGARPAFLKQGGDFPYLSVPDEVNVLLVVHLRRHAPAPSSPMPTPPPARRRPLPQPPKSSSSSSPSRNINNSDPNNDTDETNLTTSTTDTTNTATTITTDTTQSLTEPQSPNDKSKHQSNTSPIATKTCSILNDTNINDPDQSNNILVRSSSFDSNSPSSRLHSSRRTRDELMTEARAIVAADERAAVERYAFEIDQLREFIPGRDDAQLSSVLQDCSGVLDVAIERALSHEYDNDSFFTTARARAIDDAMSQLLRNENYSNLQIEIQKSIDQNNNMESDHQEEKNIIDDDVKANNNNNNNGDERGETLDIVGLDRQHSEDDINEGGEQLTPATTSSSTRRTTRPSSSFVGRGPAPFPGASTTNITNENGGGESSGVGDGDEAPVGGLLNDRSTSDPLAASDSVNVETGQSKRETLISWEGVLSQGEEDVDGDEWAQFRRSQQIATDNVGINGSVGGGGMGINEQQQQQEGREKEDGDVKEKRNEGGEENGNEDIEETEEQRRLRLWSMSALTAASQSVNR